MTPDQSATSLGLADWESGRRQSRLKNYVTAKTLEAVAFRESSRLNRGRLYGLVRTMVSAMAANLVRAGALDTTADVFFLTLDELMTEPDDLRQRVDARKRQWAEFERLPTRPRIVLADDWTEPEADPTRPETNPSRPESNPAGREDDPKLDLAPDRSSTSPHLSSPQLGRSRSVRSSSPPPLPTAPIVGTAASAGVAEGEVMVVTDPSVDATGKIVVAVSTDPGWVFLLAHAAGVITERGSRLSHTAIVARELGLPAVVGVADATTRLRTGDRVRLDATNGRIEVLSRVKPNN